MSLYVDTSALAKWYVAESGSDAFDAFICNRSPANISRLTVVELRCMLARRRRNHELSVAVEKKVFQAFQSHVRDGIFVVLAMSDAHFVRALEILGELRTVPLRTLDALHLAVAHTHNIAAIATADQVMVDAARALKFETHVFH